MLNEEFKKSEEMETLKCKMSETLECERQKRQGLISHVILDLRG